MAARKPPQQHLAGETSLLGATRSPTAVARAPVTSREIANLLGTSVKPAGSDRFRPNRFRPIPL